MNRSSTYIKILFFSVAVLLTLSLVHAQEKVDLEKMRPKRVIDEVDLLVGPNISSSLGEGYITQKKFGNTGYSIGVALKHKINDRFYLGLRFLFDEKAIQNIQTYYNDSSFLATTEINYINDYLTI